MVRIKHRYLLLNILYPESPNKTYLTATPKTQPWTVQFRAPSSDRLDTRLLLRVIRDTIAELFGDYGSGMIASSLQIKYLSTATSTAIIRVARAQYRMVWAALTFVTRFPKPVDQACVVQVVRVSGTIRKAEEEAIRRARAIIVRARISEEWSTGGIIGFGSTITDGKNDDALDFSGGIEDDEHDEDGDEEMLSD